jgi:hypothetical protein
MEAAIMSVFKIVIFDNTGMYVEESFYTDEELEDIVSAIENGLAVYPTLEAYNKANNGEDE